MRRRNPIANAHQRARTGVHTSPVRAGAVQRDASARPLGTATGGSSLPDSKQYCVADERFPASGVFAPAGANVFVGERGRVCGGGNERLPVTTAEKQLFIHAARERPALVVLRRARRGLALRGISLGAREVTRELAASEACAYQALPHTTMHTANGCGWKLLGSGFGLSRAGVPDILFGTQPGDHAYRAMKIGCRPRSTPR